MEQGKRAQPALEVADMEEALTFYGRLFEFKLRGKTSAFIDLGDQFLALQKGRTQPADEGRREGSRRGRSRSRSAQAGVSLKDGNLTR